MSSAESPIHKVSLRDIRRTALFIVAGILAGLYAVLATAVGDYRVSLVLLAAPVSFAGLAVKNSIRIYLAVLILSLSFGARFRFGTMDFHAGGAEASLAPLDFPLVGLSLIWLAQLLTGKLKLALRITGFGIVFSLFVLVHIVSVFIAYDSYLALLELLRLLKMGLLILMIRHFVKTEADLRLVLGVFFGSMILQGMLAVSQSFFDTSLGLGFLGENDTFFVQEAQGIAVGRAGGTLGHPNVLGYFFEMTLPMALAVFLRQDWGRLRIMALCALGLGLFGSFLTYSRATWVSVLIGLSVVVVATLLTQKRLRVRSLLNIAWVLLGISAIVLVFKDTILQRIQIFGSASWYFRVQTFTPAWNMVRAQPLFGVGANNYLTVIQAYSDADIFFLALQAPVHNSLLLIAAETGLFGLLAFVILLVALGHGVYQVARGGSDFVTIVALGAFAGIVSLMAHSMLDWLFRFDPIYTLFWFEVGLLLAMRQVSKRSALRLANTS